MRQGDDETGSSGSTPFDEISPEGTQLQNETMITECPSVNSSDVEVAWEEVGNQESCCCANGSSREKRRGKNLLAVLIVVAIGLVAAAVAVPLLLFHDEKTSSESQFHSNKTLTPSHSKNNDNEPVQIDPDDDGGNIKATPAPTSMATMAPTMVTNNITTFYVIGDVPYNEDQAEGIRQQLMNIPQDAEFVLHVGDLRNAGRNLVCLESDYTSAEELFRLSRAPVFMLLGKKNSLCLAGNSG